MPGGAHSRLRLPTAACFTTDHTRTFPLKIVFVVFDLLISLVFLSPFNALNFKFPTIVALDATLKISLILEWWLLLMVVACVD